MTFLSVSLPSLLAAAPYHLLCATVAAVLSWLLLGYVGESADVDTAQYRQKLHIPLAALFGFAVPLLVPGLDPVRVVGLTVSSAFLAHLAVADAGQEILPDRLNLPLFITVSVMTVTSGYLVGDPARTNVAILCGFGVFAAYLLMLAIRPHQFGAGDVKLGVSWGMMLGWYGVMPTMYGFAAGFVLHALVGIYMMLRGIATSTRINVPFGPAMIVAVYGTMVVAAR